MIYYCLKCRKYYRDEAMLEIERNGSLQFVCPSCKDNEIEDRSVITYNERYLVELLNKYEEKVKRLGIIAETALDLLTKEQQEEYHNKTKHLIKDLLKQ